MLHIIIILCNKTIVLYLYIVFCRIISTLLGNKQRDSVAHKNVGLILLLELFHEPNLMHNFLYSLTICLLHYCPRHVSSINMPIFRRKIVFTQHLVSSLSLNVCTVHWLRADCSPLSTVQTFTESEDTRCCVNTIFPPEDGHVNARNMSRIIV